MLREGNGTAHAVSAVFRWCLKWMKGWPDRCRCDLCVVCDGCRVGSVQPLVQLQELSPAITVRCNSYGLSLPSQEGTHEVLVLLAVVDALAVEPAQELARGALEALRGDVGHAHPKVLLVSPCAYRRPSAGRSCA